jgi:D-alanyl-D-alanine carboxypeptidase
MMNHKARLLGMLNTRFCNASGLPNRQQFSTARDMVRLALALLDKFLQYYRLFSVTRFSYKGRTYYNHNKLLRRYAGSDGIKTGYVRASGFNLVASARRNGRRLVAAVLGGRTAYRRDQHMIQLLDTGFIKLSEAANLASMGRGSAVAPK